MPLGDGYDYVMQPGGRLYIGPDGRPSESLGNLTDTLAPREVALPPTPAPGSDGESTQLLRRISAQHDRFVSSEVRFRWLHIGAIVAIPLFGGMWKWLLGRKKIA